MAKLAEDMVRQEPGCVREPRCRVWRAVCSYRMIASTSSAPRFIAISFRLMQTDATIVPQGVDLILISRHLERIADHATNIAEDTLFLVKGIDVRHHAESRSKE